MVYRLSVLALALMLPLVASANPWMSRELRGTSLQMLEKTASNKEQSLSWREIVTAGDRLLSYRHQEKPAGTRRKEVYNYDFMGIHNDTAVVRLERVTFNSGAEVSRSLETVYLERHKDKGFYLVPFGLAKEVQLMLKANPDYPSVYDVNLRVHSPSPS